MKDAFKHIHDVHKAKKEQIYALENQTLNTETNQDDGEDSSGNTKDNKGKIDKIGGAITKNLSAGVGNLVGVVSRGGTEGLGAQDQVAKKKYDDLLAKSKKDIKKISELEE